jgi:hypothetical protein
MIAITATDRALQINAGHAARHAAGETTFYWELPTDATYWADCGVQTGEELDRLLAYEAYVDTYKERCGFKPRGLDWRSRTASEWQAAAVDF